ncbi:MAG: hypothetical protein ACYST6_08195 [Planctomycetota bacterium]|jgi:hypothetical protein
MKAKITLLLIVAANATLLHAGIPEPDIILFGELTVGGQPQGAHDNVSIIARVSGDPNSFVGAYQMGDNPLAGDYYILRIRHESLADGSLLPSDNAALIDETVDIFVKPADYLEVYAASVLVEARGMAQYLDLDIDSPIYLSADLNTDGIVNFKDFARIAQWWDRQDCGLLNDWCDGADITHSSAVDFHDVFEVAASWLDTASP